MSFQHWWEVLSWGSRVDVMFSFSYWLMEEEWGSQSSSSHLQGFFRNFYTNLKSFRTSCDTQASLLSSFWETDLSLYAWDPPYYRDRSLTEIHSKPSVSLLSFYRNRDTLNAPELSSGMNTTPKFFTESRGTENSRLNKLLQKVTYLFVIGALELWMVQKCEVYTVTKEVVKSEV